MSDSAAPGGYDWAETADELLDEAVDREDRVACRFDDLSLAVPVRTGEDAPLAEWEFDGTVEISISGERGPLVDWMQWWNEQASAHQE